MNHRKAIQPRLARVGLLIWPKLMRGVAIVFILTTNGLALAAASFQGLGDLSGGVFQSGANAVSGNGQVVVGASMSASGEEAFYWTAGGGIVGLGDLPGGIFGSSANAVSADGSVIVGNSQSSSGVEAFRWTTDTSMTGLGDLPGGNFRSSANGITADGSIIVGTGRADTGREAFRWTANDGMVGMGFPPFLPSGPDPWSTGLGISADGSVVVGAGNDIAANSNAAYRWTEATGMVYLGVLPHDAHAPSSRTVAASADGSVVIGSSTSETSGPPGDQAFRWTESEGLVGLGFLPGPIWEYYNRATAVSASGSVIVGISDAAISEQAFLWTERHGIRSLQDVLITDLGLDLTGWTLTEATGISADGLTIVGTGINPSGDTEAFIVTLPEPGTIALIALGLPALFRRR